MKKIFIIFGVIITIIIMIISMFAGKNNKAISLEEQIKESKSSIEIQEKRRIDLILNLVDSIESYNKYEQETMIQIIDARNKANHGQVEDAEVLITAIAEQYPELKSNENYKQLMTELAITENFIAEHRNNYNIQVRNYNKYIRKFPNNIILNMMGYKKINYEYLEFEGLENAPQNLFGE